MSVHTQFLGSSSSMAATVISSPVPLHLLHRKLLPSSSSLLPITKEARCWKQSAAVNPVKEQGFRALENAAKSERKESKKLYVENLPSNFDPDKIFSLFGQCGLVNNVEIILGKDGSKKDFLFVTMSSHGEAKVAIEKLDSLVLEGKIVRVAFARRFSPAPVKPKPLSNPNSVIAPLPTEIPHKVYVSNLSWKIKSSHLRNFFKENSNAVAANAVLDSQTGRCAGYGFVSFATKEEAEDAVEALNGKELMGRPLKLRITREIVGEEGNELEDTSNDVAGSTSVDYELILS